MSIKMNIEKLRSNGNINCQFLWEKLVANHQIVNNKSFMNDSVFPTNVILSIQFPFYWI